MEDSQRAKIQDDYIGEKKTPNNPMTQKTNDKERREYPKLIGAIHTIFRLAKGALIVDRETATHFCSVKVNGEDVHLYIHDNNPDPQIKH